MMQKRYAHLAILNQILLKVAIFLFFKIEFSLAEDKGSSSLNSYLGPALGLSVGPLISSQISGVDEIVPLTTLRFGHQFSSFQLEYEGSAGAAHGISYQLLTGQVRGQIPLENFPVHWLAGVDMHRYAPVTTSGRTLDYRSGNGWHAGFGFRLPVTTSIHLRSDFKMLFSPGQQLNVNFGLEYFLQ
jgi:hypothetical protein